MAAVIDTSIPALMSVTEIADYHGVSRAAVKKAIAAGKLPACKVGATWVVRREIVEQGGQTILIESDEAPREAPACSRCGWGDSRTTSAALSVHQASRHP